MPFVAVLKTTTKSNAKEKKHLFFLYFPRARVPKGGNGMREGSQSRKLRNCILIYLQSGEQRGAGGNETGLHLQWSISPA